MKISRIILCLGLFFALINVFPTLSQGSELSEANRETLKNLLDELKGKIEDADQRMIAHPRFLEELRELERRYRQALRVVFLSDDFSDGDYTQNPAWEVASGYFQITTDNKLQSRVRAVRPYHRRARREDHHEFFTIVDDLLKSNQQRRHGRSARPEPQEAVIYTPAPIGPDFDVRLKMVSNSNWGAMEIVLLGGDPPSPRYRLIYHAAASPERPIEIVRERHSRTYLLDAATQYPSLDDGIEHKIAWMRDSDGNMVVFVDGEKVLETVELFYREGFTGLALINRGGTYGWGPIHVFQRALGNQ